MRGSGVWTLAVCVAAVVALVLPPAAAWPGMARYECHCPNNIACWRFTCRNSRFSCNCDDCSCFPREESGNAETMMLSTRPAGAAAAVPADDGLEGSDPADVADNNVDFMEMLLRSGFGGFRGRK